MQIFSRRGVYADVETQQSQISIPLFFYQETESSGNTGELGKNTDIRPEVKIAIQLSLEPAQLKFSV